jgi:hypothetical protein
VEGKSAGVGRGNISTLGVALGRSAIGSDAASPLGAGVSLASEGRESGTDDSGDGEVST